MLGKLLPLRLAPSSSIPRFAALTAHSRSSSLSSRSRVVLRGCARLLAADAARCGGGCRRGGGAAASADAELGRGP
eukprot:412642-Rhodomonas_salina.1